MAGVGRLYQKEDGMLAVGRRRLGVVVEAAAAEEAKVRGKASASDGSFYWFSYGPCKQNFALAAFELSCQTQEKCDSQGQHDAMTLSRIARFGTCSGTFSTTRAHKPVIKGSVPQGSHASGLMVEIK